MPDIFIDEKPKTEAPQTVETAPVPEPVKKKTRKKIVPSSIIEDTKPQDKEMIGEIPKPSVWQRIKEPLMAYVANPSETRFSNQEDKEQIILLLRKHQITNMPWIIAAVLALLAPVAFFPLLSFLNPFSDMPVSYHLVFSLFWYILTFSLVLVNFMHWYFNVYILTDERVVDVDFYNLVHQEIASARISKIQDVTYKVNGVIRSLFNYGDVFIQTAGTEENFCFEAVPQPQMVAKKIGELTEKNEEAGQINSVAGV